jgi:hypothetical protein
MHEHAQIDVGRHEGVRDLNRHVQTTTADPFLIAFAIAWLTVGGVAARAAGIRPAAALRYE